jgi:hypothetical protein
VREIRRTTSARHRGQRKIGISKLAEISIREVARELEEDMDLDSRPPGAAGDLNASGQGRHCPLGRPCSVGHTVERSVGRPCSVFMLGHLDLKKNIVFNKT